MFDPTNDDEIIDDDFVALVEDELGLGHGAWDMVDAQDICRAVLAVARVRGDINQLNARL